MAFQDIKRYGHAEGLSCCFRQWRAKSHCAQLHGYSLSFEFTFAADELDENGWVIDFGGLKLLKAELAKNFDHRTLVAADDPLLEWFRAGNAGGALDLLIVGRTGCEAFARMACEMATRHVARMEGTAARNLRVVSVKVSEHEGNSALYIPGE